MSGRPSISWVQYLDPWGSNPAGEQFTGVGVTVSNAGEAPKGYTLAGRLLEGERPVAYSKKAVAASTGFVAVEPPAPLAGGPFWVQVQWCELAKEPAAISWTEAGVVTAAPVITTALELTAGRVVTSSDSVEMTLGWDAHGGVPPDFAYAQLVTPSGVLEAETLEGAAAKIRLQEAPAAGYLLYLAAAAKIGTDSRGVTAYSVAPFSQASQIPVGAPTVTRVDYDGTHLHAAWTAPPAASPPPVVEEGQSLTVLSGGTPIATFPAAAGGGSAVIDLPAAGSAITVTGVTSYGAVDGPPGTAAKVLTEAPAISGVTMATGQSKTALTVSLARAAAGGAAIVVELLEEGVAVETATAGPGGATASIGYALKPQCGYAVVAREALKDGNGNTIATGPPSPAAPLVTTQPTGLVAAYDGERLELGWNAGSSAKPPAYSPLTGYEVVLTGSLSGTFATGPEPGLSLPAALEPGQQVTFEVTPLAGVAAGLPASLGYPVPAPSAPTIAVVAVDGEEVTVGWSPSPGPWLDGYVVTATGTAPPGGGSAPTVTTYTGPETTASFKLPPQEAACAWTLTVAGTARGKAGPPSRQVELFPTTALVESVSTDGSSATVKWMLEPWSSAVQSALGQARLQVQILDDGNVVAAKDVGPKASESTSVTLPTPRTGRLTAAVQLVGAKQTGARSGAVPVLTDAPTILFGALTEDSLELWWSASRDAGLSGYEVCCGSVRASTTEAEITLPLRGAEPGEVSVQALGPGSTGPALKQAIVGSYGITSGSYADGTLNVSFAAAGSAASAQVRVDALLGEEVVASALVAGTATTATLAVSLPPGTPAQVRATGVGNGSLTPAGSPWAVPTSTPANVRAVYDGAEAHVRWEPVPAPGVTGYLVTLAGAQPAVPPRYVAGASTAETKLVATLPAPFPGAATVTVQTVVAPDPSHTEAQHRLAGPASAAAVPALAGSVRAVNVPAAVGNQPQPPYLYRRGAWATFAKVHEQAVEILLANPFTQATPTVQDKQGQFKLAPSGSTGATAYALTIAAPAWTFDGNAARAGLRSPYREFLTKLDEAGAVPGGIGLVRQAVATALPQTFAETLYYRYGVWHGSASRVVDLEAGMRLRVSGAEYQTPTGSSDRRSGYVTVGADTYDLGRIFPAGTDQAGLAPALTVDAFLSQLFPGGSGGSQGTIAAGPVDFFGAGARQAYFRLFFPTAFERSENPGPLKLVENIAILGAPSWKLLEEATTTYETTAAFPAQTNLFTGYFRGRAALTPLVEATVNGRSRWMPLGTSLRDLLAAEGAPSLGAAAPATPPGVSLSRVTADVYDSALGGPSLCRDRVDLSGSEMTSAPALWPLDLPVLGGDEVSVAPWAPPIAGPP